MNKIRLAITEDNEKFRSAIIRLINMEDDLEVVLQANNGKHLLELLNTVIPDIILMDIRMPVMDGIETSARVKELYPNLKIIAFSQYDQADNIITMNINGVKSFIGKEDDSEELFRAIRIVYKGGVYMTDRSAEIVQRYLSNKNQIAQPPKLNDFQQSLLIAICKGQSSTEIGRTLNKSCRTIEEHRENLYRKFGVRTKEELLREVYKHNFV